MIKQHMLFVEDDARLLNNVVALLREHFKDFQVDGVTSVAEAKANIAQRRRQGYVTRAVVVDEDLEGSNERGSKLFEFLQGKYPGIRKVMLAGKATVEDLSNAINKGGIDRYVLKTHFTNNNSLLFHAISEVLQEKEGFIDEAIIELLKQPTQTGDAQEAILFAGRKEMKDDQLLQHITMRTREGRTHLKDFTKLFYLAFRHPELFLKEIQTVTKTQKKASARRRKPRKIRNRG